MSINFDKSIPSYREYILDLAQSNNVTYRETKLDELAGTFTRLSDDDVVLDEVENLIIALERAGVIESGDVIPLHIGYLRERDMRPKENISCN